MICVWVNVCVCVCVCVYVYVWVCMHVYVGGCNCVRLKGGKDRIDALVPYTLNWELKELGIDVSEVRVRRKWIGREREGEGERERRREREGEGEREKRGRRGRKRRRRRGRVFFPTVVEFWCVGLG